MTENLYLASCKLPSEVKKTAENLGINLLSVPESKELSFPVAAHPDMLFYKTSDNKLITDKKYFHENPEFFAELSKYTEVKTCEKSLSPNYPDDIIFDVLNIDGVLLGRTDLACPEALKEAKKTVKTKQGYARCSVMNCGKCFVSADLGLCRAISDAGYDVLKINSGHIKLDGYDYGFIGGASAYLPGISTVLFFGNPENHPDFLKIKCFLDSYDIKISYPKDVELSDFGGFVKVR